MSFLSFNSWLPNLRSALAMDRATHITAEGARFKPRHFGQASKSSKTAACPASAQSRISQLARTPRMW